MKKIVAIVLMAIAGGAHAESSIALYGILDTGVEWYNHSAKGGSFVGMPTLTGEVPSRWGMRGVEDLGDGFKAVFNLEDGFAVSNGAQNYGGRLFGRLANVGLSSRYGQVLLGRQTNMSYYALIQTDIIGPSLGAIANMDPYLANARSDNAVSYLGKFGGLSLGATYSFGRDAAGPAGPSATNCGGQVAGDYAACKQYTALVEYDFSNAGVLASYDQMHGGAGASVPLTSSAYTDTRSIVGAFYKFDQGRVGAGWIHRILDAPLSSQYDYDLYYLGASWMPTPVLTLDGQVARYVVHGYSNASLFVTRTTYHLSSSTALYALVNFVTNSKRGTTSVAAGGSVAPGDTQTGVMLGIQHKF